MGTQSLLLIIGGNSRIGSNIIDHIENDNPSPYESIWEIHRSFMRTKLNGDVVKDYPYTTIGELKGILHFLLEKLQPDSTYLLVSARSRHGKIGSYFDLAIVVSEIALDYNLFSVLFISSLAGRMVSVSQGWSYHAEKSAEVGLCRWMAVDYVGRANVNAVCIYHIEPDIKGEAKPESFLRLDDLYKVVKFLLSLSSRAITGQCIDVGTVRGLSIENL